MSSTWNAPNGYDWSILQNNTSGNYIQVVVDADESGYGNTFFYKALDKATLRDGGISSVAWVHPSFRPMFEIKD